jgi:hypothetical protein
MAASVLVGEQELEEWLADGRVRCPGCGGSAVAVGSRARAPGADALWHAPGAAATRALLSLRAHACAAAGLVGAAPARRGGVICT